MRKLAFVFSITLLAGLAAWGQAVTESGGFISSPAAVCSEPCGTQNFAIDPFEMKPGQKEASWSRWFDRIECFIRWDPATGTIGRFITDDTACDNNTGLIRYNGNISEDGCAMFKITAMTNSGFDFEPGMVMRHQGPELDQQGNPTGEDHVNGLYGTVPNQNGALVARCESGLPCHTIRLTHIASIGDVVSDCTTFGDIRDLAVGGYFGACIHGDNLDMLGKVTVFNLGSTFPGAPLNTDGGDGDGAGPNPGWGSPDCTFTVPCAIGAGVCDDSGRRWGIWMRTNDVSNGDSYKVDDFEVFSCQGT